MDTKKYQEIVDRHEVKENRLKNGIVAFIIGGLMGMIGNLLVDFYSYIFDIPSKIASTYMIITLIFIGCLLTCLGIFDKMVAFARCGLLIPITGFAHSLQSAALEYKKEGLVTGIGANIFKLAGTVILFGIISAYVFGIVRALVFGG
jgi:stage V sporulation protein AC